MLNAEIGKVGFGTFLIDQFGLGCAFDYDVIVKNNKVPVSSGIVNCLVSRI
jgi:hypothetical protein